MGSRSNTSEPGGASLTSVFQRHPNASFTRFGDEGLIVVPHGAWQVVVNGTGLRVFEMLDGKRSVSDLSQQLAQEYEGASKEQMAADVLEVLNELETKGAVQRAD